MVTEEIFLPNDLDQFAAVALEGKNTTLECTCQPNKCNEDNSDAYWKFKSHYVNQSARTMISKSGLDNDPVKILLTILNLSKADEGDYLCGINTTQGFAEKQSKLHILQKGRIFYYILQKKNQFLYNGCDPFEKVKRKTVLI